MPAKFKKGDIVRIKNPVLPAEFGTFEVRRVKDTTIGYPCYLEQVGTGISPSIYPEPEERLELVRGSGEDPRDRRIRELEERLNRIERHLGWKL